jgi:ABC-type glycerol-3-phosphate transport system permease component
MRALSFRRAAASLLSLVLVLLVVLVTCLPILMMIMGSFKEDYEIFTMTPQLLPRNGFTLTKFQQLFANWPYWNSMLNSVIVAVLQTAGACFFCTLSGYTFAKYKFPGRNALFMIVLASMMMPGETRLVPTYLLFRSLGGVNQLWSLIVPGLVPAFGVFMLRQFAVGAVPNEIMESARLEGAGEYQILWYLGFPMMVPAIFSFAILTFMNVWNDFLWPIIIISDRKLLTVTALLRSIGDSSLNGNHGMLLAATTLSALPIIILYTAFNRQLIGGIMEGTGKE